MCILCVTWYSVCYIALCTVFCCSCQSIHMRSRFVNWNAGCSYRRAQWAAVWLRCRSWMPCVKHAAKMCHSWTWRLTDLMPVVRAQHQCNPGLNWRWLTILFRDAPIIGIGWLVCWYQPIVVYTVNKYKFLFLLSKVNKHESGFCFW